MSRPPYRGLDSRRKLIRLERGRPYYSTDTGSMWVGDGKTRGGIPAPWQGHNKLPDTSYNDICIRANSITAQGGAALTYTDWLTSLRVLVFPAAGGDYGYFDLQLPHNYAVGTDPLFHVHFTNPSTIADGETVMFPLTYSKANIWGVFPAVASVTATFTNNAATREMIQRVEPAALSGTTIQTNAHLIAGSVAIPGTGLGLSSVLFCRIERASADTHNQDVYMVSADFHIQQDRMGSQEEYTK